MVATKVPSGIDLQDLYGEVFGEESKNMVADTRAARRETRRGRREASRKVSSFDEREPIVRRRVRVENARNRKQIRDTRRANVEINREIEAHGQDSADRPSIRSSYGRGDFPRWYRRKL